MADESMENNPINVTGRILEALQFAAIKHKDQRRKDPEKTPYINHPIGVAYVLWKEGGIYDSRVLQVRPLDRPVIYITFQFAVSHEFYSWSIFLPKIILSI